MIVPSTSMNNAMEYATTLTIAPRAPVADATTLPRMPKERLMPATSIDIAKPRPMTTKADSSMMLAHQ